MDVIILLVFISLILVGAALAFFRSRLKGGDLDHGDRLSLLPLQDDDGTTAVDKQPIAADRSVNTIDYTGNRRLHDVKEEGTAYESR